MSTLLDTSTDIKIIQCGDCGVWHGLPRVMHEKCASDGGFWYCPNGHSRGYSTGSLYSQLEREKVKLERERKRREWADRDVERQKKEVSRLARCVAAQKGVATKLKNRAKAGVCPCCTRTFKQLASHMKNKHPDYGLDKNG